MFLFFLTPPPLFKQKLKTGIGPTEMTEQKGNAKETSVLPLPGQACKSDKTSFLLRGGCVGGGGALQP